MLFIHWNLMFNIHEANPHLFFENRWFWDSKVNYIDYVPDEKKTAEAHLTDN